MLLSYVNRFDAYTLTPSSEAPNLPVENVQAIHLSNKWRTTAAATENVVGGSAVAFTPDCAFIAGHNISSAAVVKIQGNDADVWVGPTVDITMTRGKTVYYAFAGFAAHLYWRFLITDPTNPDGYIEIGRLWLGASTSLANGPSRGMAETMHDTTAQSFSITGQLYSDRGIRFKSYDVYFPFFTDAVKVTVETFADAVGLGVPFFITYDTAKADKLNPFYAVMSSGIGYTNLLGLVKWDGKMSFREVF